MLDASQKDALLKTAADHVAETRHVIEREMETTQKTLDRFGSDRGLDELTRQKLSAHFSERLDQLHHLFPSPYFFRCDARLETGEEKTLYFSKFVLSDQSVFSWTSPAARLRFSDLGSVSYAAPQGKTVRVDLTRKDQFMIVGGRIVFMTNETTDHARTVVHQEQLARRKTGFVLPEIVERMERAQDDVIRAPAEGSLLVAGPAGSGKTTLALHRLAYLLQSPETAERFPAKRMIVFVQDEATKAYFSRLLPDLGIHEVTITTFGAWALERLGLRDITAVRRPNGADEATDAYEFHKCQALRAIADAHKRSHDPFATLHDVYRSHFTATDEKRFAEQTAAREMDRFDLSILLHLSLQQKGPFTEEQEYLVQGKNFSVTRRRRIVPLTYALVVVDEAQNYLPEQITALRTCVDPRNRALLYVGDLGQQVLLGTVRDWAAIGEDFSSQRKVTLEKVYRNTQHILRYAASLGFPTTIPEELTEGVPVTDVICETTDDALAQVRDVIQSKGADLHVGILAPSAAALKPFAAAFADQPTVHPLTVHEAQGVEFDIVCLVGFTPDFFATTGETTGSPFEHERAHIKRDLLYVALTRAMDRLCVFRAPPCILSPYVTR